MIKKEIGLVYFCIYNKLRIKAKESHGDIIRRAKAFEVIGREFHINKELHTFVLKELELFGFLESSTDKFLHINKVKDFDDMQKKRILQIKRKF